jgi:glutamate-1-semialdehyde 2,1-aminomutase
VHRYHESERHLIRAENLIPLGSQTFSKSRTQYPVGVSPLYVHKAKGCMTWDLDGNKYIDLVSSLASITIGHSNRYVNRAVRKQLKKGVNFSLPGILEAEVAELICNLVPSAEMVRFGKNGSDATAAAVRLSRAFTGRDHVAVCGYHGWQDWFIGSTSRDKGVPRSVAELTHVFKYNDLDSLETLIRTSPALACVVLEPMNTTFPNPGFLEGVRELTQKHGIILVFDETITGFRFSEGGAQELFNVIPDLTTFGKGIANGFPLSAVVGKKEIMLEMENIFFSGTNSGELLSLAAAKTVLEMHSRSDVCSRLADAGTELQEKCSRIIDEIGMTEYLEFTGHPTWKFIKFSELSEPSPDFYRTFFMQEMFSMGILVLNSHNVTLALNRKKINKIVDSYGLFLEKLKSGLVRGDLSTMLKVDVNKPLFKVRG